MKTIKRTLTLTALLFGLLFTFANANLKKGDYVEISNSSGDILYSGRVNNTGNLTKVFNFSNLNNGKYKVEVSKGYIIEINTVQVKNNTVKVLENAKQQLHKPVFRTENEKVIISKITTERENVSVELFYNDEMIYKDNIENSEAILNRIYKLDATKKGSYTAIIKTANREFVEYFEL